MKFLLDSCISFFAVKALRERDFVVKWIPEMGKDPGDEEIIKRAFKEDMVLVTADKDFGEFIFLWGMGAPTIIRLVDIPARDQGKILLRLIEVYKTEIEKKVILTVQKYRVRIRYLYE